MESASIGAVAGRPRSKHSTAKTTMIRIELVEDGLPTSVLYGYVDTINDAILREHEAFEWALARLSLIHI